VIALLLPAALSLAAFGPRIFGRMTNQVLSATTQDGTIFVWMYRWWPYALSHHLNPFFTKMAWAPQGINLAWVTSIPAPAVVMAPVTGAFGAMFSFNAMQLAAPVLASWTAYLLCRRIVGSFWPALAGGLFFGFCPDLIDEFGQGHPNLALVFLVPLAAYLVLRLLEGSLSWRWFVPLAGLVLAVQLYISTEVAVTLTAMGAIYALLGWAFGRPEQRRRLLWAIGPILGGYAVAALLAVPLVYVAFTEPRPFKPFSFGTIGHGAHGPGDFLRYFVPGRYTLFGDQFGARWGVYGNPWYFGFPLLLFLLLFMLAQPRLRRTWLLVAGFAVTILISIGNSVTLFGAHVLPWRLFAMIPVIDRAQPGRLVAYAFLITSVMIALWLKQGIRPVWRALRWALVVIAAAAITPNVVSNVWARSVPLPRLLATGAYHRFLQPGDTVWIVDPRRSRAMVWQASTGFSFRMAGGFFGVTPPGLPDPQAQAWLGPGVIAGSHRPDIRTFLKDHDVGTVLMFEEPLGDLHIMARATGVHGVSHGQVIVFQLDRKHHRVGRR
jgi:hypothetical protein